MPLQKQNINIPLAQGLNTKVDPTQQPPGTFKVLQNVKFTTMGELKKRNGYSAINLTSVGGNAVSNGVGALVISSGIGTPPDLTVTQDVPSNSFSFSQSFTQADGIAGSAVTTGDTPNFSDNVVSIAGGTAGNLAGTITSAGAITLTAGGHNTEAVGQVITTLIVD